LIGIKKLFRFWG